MLPEALKEKGLNQIFKKTETSNVLRKILFQPDKLIEFAEQVFGEKDLPEEWAAHLRAWFMPLFLDATEKGHARKTYKAFNLIAEHVAEKLPLKEQRKAQEVIYSHAPASLVAWMLSGKKEYKVSKGLEQKLRNTHLRNYPSENFKLPFHAIYLHIDWFENIQGVLICQAEDRLVLLPFNNKETYSEIALKLGEGKSLDQCIKEKPYPDKNVKQRWKTLFSFIINTVLYATMQDAEEEFQYYDKSYVKLQKRLKKAKTQKKRENIKKQLKSVKRDGYTYLGGSIKVDRTYVAESPERTQPSGRTVNVRFLVSGHWRNQPTNEGIKRIWIEPFWKGPEQAPLTGFSSPTGWKGKAHHLK